MTYLSYYILYTTFVCLCICCSLFLLSFAVSQRGLFHKLHLLKVYTNTQNESHFCWKTEILCLYQLATKTASSFFAQTKPTKTIWFCIVEGILLNMKVFESTQNLFFFFLLSFSCIFLPNVFDFFNMTYVDLSLIWLEKGQNMTVHHFQ